MTYNERLNNLATEMAKLYYTSEAMNHHYIQQCKPLAAIALKHMATMYIIGFTDGIRKESNIELMGLIEPQTT